VPPTCRFRSGGLDLGFGQPFELGGRIDDQRDVVDFFQHVLRELGAEPGQLTVDLAQARLLLIRKPRAGANEITMGFLEQAQLLGIEPQRFALLIQAVDPGKQLGIELDRIAVCRQPRRHLTLDLLAFVVGVGADQVEEHRGHARQGSAAALHRNNRVVEARRIGIAGNGLDLGQMLFHTALHRRDEVLIANPVERRHLQRQRGDFKERIHGRLLGHVGGHFSRLLDGCAACFGHLRVGVLATAGGQAQQRRDDQTQSGLGHLNVFPVRFFLGGYLAAPDSANYQVMSSGTGG